MSKAVLKKWKQPLPYYLNKYEDRRFGKNNQKCSLVNKIYDQATANISAMKR